MQTELATLVTRGLTAIGVWDPTLPRSYAEGAAPLRKLAVAEVPPPPAPAGIAAALATDEVSGGGYALDEMGGLALTVDNLESVLDDMVRPALNADGGDIHLHRIDENGNVYVKLVGACGTCPSAVMTMRMGVERLLQEEFPGMGDLIQVDGLA